MPTAANMANMASILDITPKRRKLKIVHARHVEYLIEHFTAATNSHLTLPKYVYMEYAQRHWKGQMVSKDPLKKLKKNLTWVGAPLPPLSPPPTFVRPRVKVINVLEHTSMAVYEN